MQKPAGEKRTSIPSAVKEVLRAEVGFGCPAENCGSPYLEYHHFDPPVHIRPHNEPGGMIALCPSHHAKADGGAYSNEQLHKFKKNKVNSEIVKGNLDYLRNKLLAIVGGNFYYDIEDIITIDGEKIISLRRDNEGYLRLTAKVPSMMPEERLVIEDHSWEKIGLPKDLRSPPQGKELEVTYKNGDYLFLRFGIIKDRDEAKKRYNTDILDKFNIEYPITTLEINLRIANTSINLTPKGSKIGGAYIRGSIIFNGIKINPGVGWNQNKIFYGYVFKRFPIFYSDRRFPELSHCRY